ncbi:hypothetical protein A1D29_08030 [Pasteurellaceae bacterium Orientalotternb1]|nr:hypothetical protein A1D29_08030 [Pasteurellaceae bacterium Orientalotternb1]
MKNFKLNSLVTSLFILSSTNAALAEFSESEKAALGLKTYSEQTIFNRGDDPGALYWRIPSLLNTQKGTLIAAVDKHWQHNGDWGDKDTVIRISHNQGKDWGAFKTIINLQGQNVGEIPTLPESHSNNRQRWGVWDRGAYANSAFLIDPVLLQDRRNHRIFMAIDMFPESKGFFSTNNLAGNGNGHINIDGKNYLRLNRPDKTVWTLRENGHVYDNEGRKTDYRVVTQGNPDIAFNDLGDIYQGDQKLGNIYLTISQQNANAPFTVNQTGYFWITHSDDEGQSWASPVDISAQVKKDWMRFFGTGPGVGIQTKKGNLIIPIYYTNQNSAQSSALIISQDGGKTWQLGESPNDSRREILAHGWNSQTMAKNLPRRGPNVEITESQVIELDNGDLKLFMRNASGKVLVATSKTGGFSWLPEIEKVTELNNPHSQLSVIKYSKKIDGKEYILFSGPSESGGGAAGRRNGKLFLGEVQADGSIQWTERRMKAITSTGKAGGAGQTQHPNGYVYSSMAELDDGRIGLLYENTTDHTSIVYIPIDMQEFFLQEHKIFSDSREGSPREVSLDSLEEKVFHKVGDGEILKVGQGVNLAHLIVTEGGVTLNQSANNQGEKLAYSSVFVAEGGKVRLGSADQIPLNRLYLNQGTLDLNGNDLTINHLDQLKPIPDDQGQYNDDIYGNIVNENIAAPATLTYTNSGAKNIVGQLGNQRGQLNFTYQPAQENSTLAIYGNTALNTLDVKSGTITYTQGSQHQVKTVKLGENTHLALGSNTTTAINSAQFAGDSSTLSVSAIDNETSQLQVNTTGRGHFVKTGSGLLTLAGDLTHLGETRLQQGKVDFNGSLTNNTLTVQAGVTLGGQATITGNTILENGSTLSPGFNQTGEFSSKVMQFANITNQGTQVLLRVNNTEENTANWQHDQLIVTGKVDTQAPIPVDVRMLGGEAGNTDTNSNGKYDIDEGISLIQVAAESNKLQQFVLRDTLTRARANGLFQNALVSVDQSVSHQAGSQLGEGKKFYDYRLQTLLVDAQGNSPEAVIRSVSKNGSSLTQTLPTLSELEIAKLLLAEKQQELEQAKAAQLAAEQKAQQAAEQKAAAEQNVQLSAAEKAAAEQKAKQLSAEKAAAELKAQQAAKEKLAAQESLNQLQAEIATKQAQKQQQMANAAKQYRAALHQKVPSYLVANTAMLNQGESIRRQFMGNIWSDDKKGFYVNQQNGNTTYRSNLDFTDYGYGYKANQSSTLFGDLYRFQAILNCTLPLDLANNV